MERSFFDWIVFLIGKYWPQFLQGAGTTLLIALVGTIIGFFIGLMIGVIKTIPLDKQPGFSLKRIILRVVNGILTVYIEVFRGTPMIVQAVVIYYGFATIGIDLPALTAAFFVVSINTGAYMAEVIRGGIISIDQGQREAAHALGMSHAQTMISVVLPQAIRNILPATGNEFIINIKDTAVLNVIQVSELYMMTNTVSGNYLKFFESFTIAAVIYLVMTISVSRILRFLEGKMDGPDSYTIMSSSTMPESVLPRK